MSPPALLDFGLEEALFSEAAEGGVGDLAAEADGFFGGGGWEAVEAGAVLVAARVPLEEVGDGADAGGLEGGAGFCRDDGEVIGGGGRGDGHGGNELSTSNA